jgi:hypothetical protein
MANKENTPLWQLTVEEFITLLKENGVGMGTQTVIQPEQPTKNYVYGLNGLATLLDCSKVTAQKIKKSGQIDSCFSQIGRKLVFDADKVLLTTQNKK